MEGIIKVTPEELITAAGDFSTEAGNISNYTTNMVEIVDGLTSIWEGEAQAAYSTKFHGLDDDIQKMIRMVQEHASDLDEMARQFQNAETSNMDEIGSLLSDVIQ
ncbi:MAG: WXG100 family type VII secretion target [Lachnospiraceae bacterium]|nr:WXG100 family type VII secretion target [Lachnospiraceae bacterium]